MGVTEHEDGAVSTKDQSVRASDSSGSDLEALSDIAVETFNSKRPKWMLQM